MNMQWVYKGVVKTAAIDPETKRLVITKQGAAAGYWLLFQHSKAPKTGGAA